MNKMFSTHQNSQKVERSKKLQKLFYSFYFWAAMVIDVGSFLTLIATLFSIINFQITATLLIIFAIITFAILVIFALFIYLLNSKKNPGFTPPSYMSEKVLIFFRNMSFVFLFLVFAFGVFMYRGSRIEQHGNIFIDKFGKEYSYSEFLSFTKWESILAITFSLAGIQSFLYLPLIDEIKEWWKPKDKIVA